MTLDENIEKLKRYLLSLGGLGFQTDQVLKLNLMAEDIESLLSRGVAKDGRGAKIIPGDQSGCHGNVLLLSAKNLKNPQFLAWTGLALSDDGIWRVHSWAENERRIIETTEPRVKYFGYCLAPLEFVEMFFKYMNFVEVCIARRGILEGRRSA